MIELSQVSCDCCCCCVDPEDLCKKWMDKVFGIHAAGGSGYRRVENLLEALEIASSPHAHVLEMIMGEEKFYLMEQNGEFIIQRKLPNYLPEFP